MISREHCAGQPIIAQYNYIYININNTNSFKLEYLLIFI